MAFYLKLNTCSYTIILIKTSSQKSKTTVGYIIFHNNDFAALLSVGPWQTRGFKGELIYVRIFVHNHGQKKQQPTISTFFKKVPSKKGELLLLLPHSVNFNVKMKPCGNNFWKYIFVENLVGESSPIQNLVILCKENEVKFRRGKLMKFWLENITYIICCI